MRATVKWMDGALFVGESGSGKSTLLKVLSRITRPTEGEADVFGRVGSLLEVGTGFHPELTGRENIALAGALMGIDEKVMEEITPVINQIVKDAMTVAIGTWPTPEVPVKAIGRRNISP